MTKLSKYQLTHLNQNTQFILFSIEGKLLESCDSLFPTSTLTEQVVFEWFPFLEGIADVLQMMELGQEMLFQRVQKPSASLSGAYDYRNRCDFADHYGLHRSVSPLSSTPTTIQRIIYRKTTHGNRTCRP